MIRSYQISDKAFHFIISESAYHFPIETGGILVGKIEQSCVIIQYAIGPGPQAQHTLTNFKRDGDFSQNALDALVRESNGESDYVGEWHSHPSKSKPSHVDLCSMKWIALNEKYDTKQPIMLLCVNEGLNRWQLLVYSFIKGKFVSLSVSNP